MVVLNRIYTGLGDGGGTALGNGERVPKTSVRVEAYGTVDEANAAIGLARVHARGEMEGALARIQNDLFDLGADLCVPVSPDDESRLRIVQSHPLRLEAEIDAMNGRLEPLRSFVLPGGTPLAAALHHARTVARRAERRAFELAACEAVGEEVTRYLNRLSDWLFVAARVANADGLKDVLWRPAANVEADSDATANPARSSPRSKPT